MEFTVCYHGFRGFMLAIVYIVYYMHDYNYDSMICTSTDSNLMARVSLYCY